MNKDLMMPNKEVRQSTCKRHLARTKRLLQLGIYLYCFASSYQVLCAQTNTNLLETKNRNHHALLVGCTIYPNLKDVEPLQGTKNDVLLMQNLLVKRFLIPEKNIVTVHGFKC